MRLWNRKTQDMDGKPFNYHVYCLLDKVSKRTLEKLAKVYPEEYGHYIGSINNYIHENVLETNVLETWVNTGNTINVRVREEVGATIRTFNGNFRLGNYDDEGTVSQCNGTIGTDNTAG